MIRAYIDGGARGNPGPAGYGVRIEDADGTLVEELYGAVGIATNNVAEYKGLLAALEWAIDHGHRDLQIRADSELLVKQMRGEYRVKNPGLQPLVARARLLIVQLDGVTFEHIRRDQNKEADRLSNLGMDEAEGTLRADVDKGKGKREKGKETGEKGQVELF
jgi:ribonuclease HI